MSNQNHLTVELRTEFGKGAARRVRRAGKVPAVLYGHGTQPVHITMPGHDAMMALKHANALLALDIDGKEQLALAKDVQRNPIKPIIEHHRVDHGTALTRRHPRRGFDPMLPGSNPGEEIGPVARPRRGVAPVTPFRRRAR